MNNKEFDDVRPVLQNVSIRTKANIIGNVFSNDTNNTESYIHFEEVELSLIVPRAKNEFIQSNIRKLADSIKLTNNRLINPIILAPISSIKEDSELNSLYALKNINLEGKKYYIVSGERRYRAFCMLYDEFNKKMEEEGFFGNNPFSTITANILTGKELENEEIYYADSNIQSRQLTTLECLLHVRNILGSINTPEGKNAALEEMRNNPDYFKNKNIEVPTKFKEAEYILYYLENILGFTNWTNTGSVRANLTLIRYASDKLMDEVLENNIPIYIAREIIRYSKDEQEEQIKLYKEDVEKYRERIKSLGKAEKKNTDAYTELKKSVSETRRSLKDKEKKLNKNRRKFDDETKKKLDEAGELFRRLDEALKKIGES